MSLELIEQRKIPVGPPGAPTYIGEFHQRYGQSEQLFHSYCREHESFGFCGIEADALSKTEEHLTEAHRDLIGASGSNSFAVEEAELSEELIYRLRTVAALALLRGKHGEKLPETFIEDQAKLAVSSLAAKSKK